MSLQSLNISLQSLNIKFTKSEKKSAKRGRGFMFRLKKSDSIHLGPKIYSRHAAESLQNLNINLQSRKIKSTKSEYKSAKRGRGFMFRLNKSDSIRAGPKIYSRHAVQSLQSLNISLQSLNKSLQSLNLSLQSLNISLQSLNIKSIKPEHKSAKSEHKVYKV